MPKTLMPSAISGTALHDVFGDGDMLQQQQEDINELARKKKKNAAANGNPAAYGDTSIPSAASMIYGREIA